MYDSIFTGGEIDKGVGRSYVPTLQSTPTTSTLTFTLEGNTIDFEIGQMVRVNTGNGYKFYQLIDLQSNGTVAIWQDMGTPLEKLTLSVTSNNASVESSLRSSAVITVIDENQNEIFRGTLPQAKTLQLFPGVSYTVTAAAVTGYITPQSQTFTAEYEGIRSIQMQYDTTVLTVTLSSDTGEADLSNVIVTVTDTTISSTVSAQQNGTYLIPVGHGFTVDVSDNVTGYNAPVAYTGTATGTAASVTMTYTEVHEVDYVDLGLPSGKKWAVGNLVKDSQGNYSIGAETDWGTYVSWGNIVGHNEGEGYNFDHTTYDSTPGKQVAANIPSNDAAHDIALATLGSPWHLPTKEDCQELYDNTDSEWVADYNGTGVAGRKFMKKSDHSVYVFSPASGRYNGTSLNYRGTSGFYWSSSFYSATSAYYLYFNSPSVYPQDYDSRLTGFTVRPVQ